ncbi:hypothetical protein [Streptomyces bicolor]|uniref:hypothetical protein n=1 Tax=Streptomyces bicolor TaxID=66874 RepID=UPI0004E1E7AD|nr:hypothetical protein [Streptomyces bicolor]
MDRLLHHELRAAFSVLASTAVSVTVAFLVRGFPSVEPRTLGFFALLLAWLVVWNLLKMTRIKGFSEVRRFEKAVSVEDTRAVLPAHASLRDSWFSRGLFFRYFVPTLPVAVFWWPWVAVFPLMSALDWLGEAATVARWERGNGLLLWRGHVESRPWELSVSRRRPTRTASDAPPGSPTPPSAPGLPEDRHRTERSTT